MKGVARAIAAVILGLVAAQGLSAQKQKGDDLTDDEEDKLREAQDPSARLELYIAFAQARLERFDDYRQRPVDPAYDTASYLDGLLGQYISLTDELKNWIQTQYDRRNDMRGGLRKFLTEGPRQLDELRHAQQSQDPYSKDYARSLRDAIDDLSDALDGATQALADQQKIFADEKREAKADEKLTKERQKDEKKRAKEEKKLRKKEHKKGIPGESDEN